MIVPRLSKIIRSSHLPTTIRTSAISLLGQCADTHSLALLPYSTDLTEGMIDLLQIESVAARNVASADPPKDAKPKPSEASASASPSDSAQPSEKRDVSKNTECKSTSSNIRFTRPPPSVKDDDEPEEPVKKPAAPPTMDSDPASANSRFPPLRRAALYFLALLIRSSTKHAYDSSTSHSNSNSAFQFHASTVRRAKTVLSYVSATDPDNVVRIMARETVEALEGLERALLGI